MLSNPPLLGRRQNFFLCGTEILPANDSMMSGCAVNKRTEICPENRDLNLGR